MEGIWQRTVSRSNPATSQICKRTDVRASDGRSDGEQTLNWDRFVQQDHHMSAIPPHRVGQRGLAQYAPRLQKTFLMLVWLNKGR